jgi:hypothetical protein
MPRAEPGKGLAAGRGSRWQWFRYGSGLAALLLALPGTLTLAASPAAQPAVQPAADAAGLAVSAEALLPFADVEWRDQLGGRDRLAAHRGERVVLIVVEARRLPLAGRWAEALQARDPKLVVLTLADAPPAVPVDPVRFAATLRRRVPTGVRVWLDPERRLATALALVTAEPNLLLLAPDGALKARFRGRADEVRIAAVMTAVAALPAAAP